MRHLGAFIVLLLILAAVSSVVAAPLNMNYQGELYKNGSAFTGTADFKASIFDSGAVVWSHDVSGYGGGEPTTSFPVTVDQGIFSMRLGEAPMLALLPASLAGIGQDPVIRLWVDTGDGFEQLPDQVLASSVFALWAENVENALGDFTVYGQLHVGNYGIKFADGTVLTSAGSVGGDSLWTESGGDIYRDFGNVGIGVLSPSERLHVYGKGRFDFGLGGSVDISTPGGWPGIIGITPSGLRRDIIFDDTVGIRMLVSYDGNAPSATQGIHIDADGRLGVGKVPTTALSVLGTAQATSFQVSDNTNIKGTLGYDGVNLGGVLKLRDASDDITFNAEAGNSGASLDLHDGTPGKPATVQLNGLGGEIKLTNNNSVDTVTLQGHAFGQGSQMRFRRSTGILGVEITSQASEMKLFDDSGATSVWITGSDGNDEGRVMADVVQITGGSDLSEKFEIDDRLGPVEPGMVVSIDPNHPGNLVVSDAPYQKTVAGIVSGAGGVKPGMLMGQEGTIADGRHAVALTGRVWAQCDASEHPIEPGDMLTTSSVPGHAMAVTDPGRAHGAVIGKAMTALDGGRGLVLVLVGLQ